MALLATSCTMRNKPSLLLDKGPDYLRTRTNREMFADRRKSAVELLAASRPQYVKSAAVLDCAAAGLIAGTPDRNYRPICQPRDKPPVRSKSEFDISRLHELQAQEDPDNGPSGEINPDQLSAKLRPLSASDERREREGRDVGKGKEVEKEEEGEAASARTTTPTSQVTPSSPPPPPPPLQSPPPVPPRRDRDQRRQRKINTSPRRQDENKPFFHSTPVNVAASTAEISTSTTKTTTKPTPPPRPPSSSLSLSCVGTQSPCAPAVYTARPIHINLTGAVSHSAAGIASEAVLVPPPRPARKPKPPPKPERLSRVLSTAHNDDHHHQQQQLHKSPAAMSEESSDKTPTNPTGGDLLLTPEEGSSSAATAVLSAEAGHSEEEEEEDGEEDLGIDASSSPASGEAITAAAATGTLAASSSSGPRVCLRRSGESITVGGSFNPVPRSFSDIVCHHHSSAGSDVSSENSRASRASAGANLEKFFNEMGMERDILDPMMRLQQRYGGGSEMDIYESLSSLESHDARSICSALSRSEKEISDPESFERNQQQTSVVERNARIIKWLCSVRKAKTPAANLQGSAASLS